jgi:DNA modification methylase
MNVILQGDAIEKLDELEAGSVHTCITSPPYYGLRDYGKEGQIGLEQTPGEYVGIELNPDYIRLAEERLSRVPSTLF